MIELAHPWFLLLLAVLPPALWHWQRQGRGAVRFSSAILLVGLPSRRARWLRHGGLALRALGLTAAVVALAGPRWPDEGSRIPAEGVSLALVLDVSRSMAEPDFPWPDAKISRLDGVKKMLHLFVAGGTAPGGTWLDGRPEDLLALVTFAARPETVCPLTLDHHALLQMLDEQTATSAVDEGTTNPGDALAWALHVLQHTPTRRRAIVLMTDGESNVPRGLRPRQAAQLAKNLGVPIYAVDAAPDPAPGEDAADAAKTRDTLETVARMTGGRYYRAHDSPALAEACRQIDVLEKSRIESFQYRRHHEAFAWLAAAARVLVQRAGAGGNRVAQGAVTSAACGLAACGVACATPQAAPKHDPLPHNLVRPPPAAVGCWQPRCSPFCCCSPGGGGARHPRRAAAAAARSAVWCCYVPARAAAVRSACSAACCCSPWPAPARSGDATMAKAVPPPAISSSCST